MNELVESLERLLELRKSAPEHSKGKIDRAVNAVVEAMEARAKSTAQDTQINPDPGSPWWTDKSWMVPCDQVDRMTAEKVTTFLFKDGKTKLNKSLFITGAMG